jgi:hypothetical protein
VLLLIQDKQDKNPEMAAKYQYITGDPVGYKK